MTRDEQRTIQVVKELVRQRWDALACALPANVRLLTGYWPVVGRAVALVTREGRIGLLAPRDEAALAHAGFADQVVLFQPASLDRLDGCAESMTTGLDKLAQALGLSHGRVGHDGGAATEPVTYSAMFLYGDALPRFLGTVLPYVEQVGADEVLGRLRSTLTPMELDRLRAVCRLAERGFSQGRDRLRPGLLETDAALHFVGPMADGLAEGVERAGGFVFCMSGPHGAEASRAYARSRPTPIAEGALALIHCNSYGDGLWTDITRTYLVGAGDAGLRRMYEAVFSARKAVLATLRPGARASEADRAARQVLRERGFGEHFTHATGHGVGFGAIDPDARPRLHPCSPDVLEPGMVFNVEPAIYIEGLGGLRHCDMVAVTRDGAEVLTSFHAEPSDLLR